MRTSIISVANQKGGVGKTTSAANMASAFAADGKKVLLVDFDYQGNLTGLFGLLDEAIPKHCVSRIISDESSLGDLIVNTEIENIDIVPATRKLDDVKEKFSQIPGNVHILEHFLRDPIIDSYDIVFIDTHPGNDDFFKAALTASHYYIIPIFPEKDAINGIIDQIKAADKIKKYLNPMLHFLGVFFSKFNKDKASHKVNLETLLGLLECNQEIRLLKTKIPESDAVASASTSNMPLRNYMPHLPIVRAYSQLSGEILQDLKGKRTGRRVKPVNVESLPRYNNNSDSFEVEVAVEF